MHIMIDLETMSSNSHAAVIAIGAVSFDLKKGVREGFYVNIDLEDNEKYGREISASTVKWWLKQSAEARKALEDGQVSLPEGLNGFTAWVKTALGSETLEGMWGNGADFDNVILRHAYEATKIATPWSHRQNRCYRTLKSLINVPFNRVGVHHNAVDDAKSQAIHCIDLLKKLGS